MTGVGQKVFSVSPQPSLARYLPTQHVSVIPITKLSFRRATPEVQT